MNPIVSLIVKTLLEYLESHPDQIKALIIAGLDWAVASLTKLKVPA